MKLRGVLLLCVLLVLGSAMAALAQSQRSTTCTFTDGKSLRVTYAPAPFAKNLPKQGVWSPGDQPMLLFTEAPIEVGGSELPIGAYRVYLEPEAHSWSLIVNRNVNAGAKYDKSADLASAPGGLEKLPVQQKSFQAYFAHVAPKQCHLRLDYGMTRATVLMAEK